MSKTEVSRTAVFAYGEPNGVQTRLCWLAGFDDLGKTANFEARAADQRSVDIRLAQQLLGVCRLHTTTILDANLVSRCLVREFFED